MKYICYMNSYFVGASRGFITIYTYLVVYSALGHQTHFNPHLEFGGRFNLAIKLLLGSVFFFDLYAKIR